MREAIKKELMHDLQETLDVLEKEEYARLKEISDHTVRNASIYQDQDSIALAVAVYSMYKIITRCVDCQKNLTPIQKHLVAVFRKARDSLQKGNFKQYNISMQNIFSSLTRLDNKLKLYIQHIINQAEIRKGSKLYEKGLSLARSAEIMGVTQWELMSYVGKTSIAEKEEYEGNVKKRVQLARKLFGVGV
jgi:hypothetical protein